MIGGYVTKSRTGIRFLAQRSIATLYDVLDMFGVIIEFDAQMVAN